MRFDAPWRGSGTTGVEVFDRQLEAIAGWVSNHYDLVMLEAELGAERTAWVLSNDGTLKKENE